jgi:alpha-D-ribose 1-methylphosphonate 5-triphosphate synthase subunit PhnG
MHHSQVIANCPAEAAYELGAGIAVAYPGDITVLTGPRLGLVMLSVQESVAESAFYAGEILVTEVTLELAGRYGFGMVLGNDPRRALAAALVDAALSLDGDVAARLRRELNAESSTTWRSLYRRNSGRHFEPSPPPKWTLPCSSRERSVARLVFSVRIQGYGRVLAIEPATRHLLQCRGLPETAQRFFTARHDRDDTGS